MSETFVKQKPMLIYPELPSVTMIKRFLAFAIIFAALQGCAGEYLASLQADSDAKIMHPSDGRALVYVYRDGQLTQSSRATDFAIAGSNCQQPYESYGYNINVAGISDKQSRLYPVFDDTYYVFDISAGNFTILPAHQTNVLGVVNSIFPASVQIQLTQGDTQYVRLVYDMKYRLFYSSSIGVGDIPPRDVARAVITRSRLLRVIRCE